MLSSIVLLLTAFLASSEAHFVNSSGAPFPGPVRQYSMDKLDVKMLYEKGFCGCFCKLTNDQYWTLCRGKECVEVPRKVKIVNRRLSVAGTMITSMGPADLADYPDLIELDFSGNALKQIMEDTFIGLNQLVNLSISSNHLESLPMGAFRGLLSLRLLKLNKNRFTTLSNLVPSLVTLPQLHHLNLNENTLSRVNADDFTSLSNSTIQILELDNCDLKYIASEAFLPLSNLIRLTLSVNIMPDDNLVHVFYTMRQSGLQELDLSHLGFEGTPPRNLLEVLSRTTLWKLDLSQNTLPRLNKATFPLMPNILDLDLNSCDIISIENDTFSQLPNLKRLNLAHNCLGTFPPAVTRLPRLEWLDMMNVGGGGEIELNEGMFMAMLNLTYLDLSGNRIGHLAQDVFAGLGRLKELRLSNCSLYKIDEGSFQHLESLKTLQMDGNGFGKHNFSRITFKDLHELEYLNMDRCKLTFTNENGIFSGATSLKVLSLKFNQIQLFDTGNPFYGAFSLVHLDLSSNNIRYWSSRLFENATELELLDLSENDIPSITQAMLEDFATLSDVNLIGNPLDCDCQLAPLRRYVLDHKDTNDSNLIIRADHCTSPDVWRFQPITSFLLDLDEGNCQENEDGEMIGSGSRVQLGSYANRPYVIAMCVILPLLALVALTFYGLYKSRWLIRLHFFRKRLTKTDLLDMEAAGNDFVYDAFVSYSNEDQGFVAQLVGMLEDVPPHYKLCVYERDFTAGNVLNDCIVQSIATSRKVVMVVSEHFVQSHWCLWELHLAQHSLLEEKRNGLVMVVVGKLKAGQLPPTLRFLMSTRIYLEWDPEPRKQELFWERLRGALAPSSSANGTSRHNSSTQLTIAAGEPK